LELTRCYSEPTSLVSNPLVSHDPEFRKHWYSRLWCQIKVYLNQDYHTM
jgi:hypothetical protein